MNCSLLVLDFDERLLFQGGKATDLELELPLLRFFAESEFQTEEFFFSLFIATELGQGTFNVRADRLTMALWR